MRRELGPVQVGIVVCLEAEEAEEQVNRDLLACVCVWYRVPWGYPRSKLHVL